MKKTLLISILMVAAAAASAQDNNGSIIFTASAGFSVGGTAPLQMPAEIRSINSFSLTPNYQASFLAEKTFGQCGIVSGIRFEDKGMKEEANVKNYHMAIVQGEQSIEGQFTGDVTTEVRQMMLTVPVMLSWRNNSESFRLRFGPYASYLLKKGFSGYARNGYLRLGDPTGPKIVIGDGKDRGDYDFSTDMRRMQYGLDLGCDWFFLKHLGMYADIEWGLTGIHHSGFKTVEQTLYPIYGTLGLTYRF